MDRGKADRSGKMTGACLFRFDYYVTLTGVIRAENCAVRPLISDSLTILYCITVKFVLQ